MGYWICDASTAHDAGGISSLASLVSPQFLGASFPLPHVMPAVYTLACLESRRLIRHYFDSPLYSLEAILIQDSGM
jgi:hypothetical protein